MKPALVLCAPLRTSAGDVESLRTQHIACATVAMLGLSPSPTATRRLLLRTHDDLADVMPIALETTVQLELRSSKLTLPWGEPHHLGTCAYWTRQADRVKDRPLAQCDSVQEEVVFCLLGGYGITYALNRAAFGALAAAKLTTGAPSSGEIESVLLAPLTLPGGSVRRYRFPRQRAERIATALRMLHNATSPDDPVELRDWLTGLPGVGPKTASWIVRNRSSDDRVAVIDVHIRRAGLAAGFFDPGWRLPRHYAEFELAFCAVARLGNVPTAALDLVIWDQLQSLGSRGHLLIGQRPYALV
jgi:N-glycosylase/DNA lyase